MTLKNIEDLTVEIVKEYYRSRYTSINNKPIKTITNLSNLKKDVGLSESGIADIYYTLLLIYNIHPSMTINMLDKFSIGLTIRDLAIIVLDGKNNEK